DFRLDEWPWSRVLGCATNVEMALRAEHRQHADIVGQTGEDHLYILDPSQVPFSKPIRTTGTGTAPGTDIRRILNPLPERTRRFVWWYSVLEKEPVSRHADKFYCSTHPP